MHDTPSRQTEAFGLGSECSLCDLSYGAATDHFDHKADLLQRLDIGICL